MVVITLWLQVLNGENWRNWAVMRTENWLHGDAGTLAAGMLWGGSGNLSYQTREAYRRVGLLHIVAASGYNVTLMTGWILSVGLIWLSRRWALGVTIIGVIIYMIIAGMQPSIIRAGIMSILAMVGLILGRERDAKWLLVITGGMMLAWNPKLISDIGFQLSFAATWGLVWLAPKGDLGTTLAAQAMTTPLILHHFGNLSVISPLVNAALLWTVPLIMQITAVGLVWGPINWLAWPLLRGQLWVVSSVASWPISSWEVGKMSWLWVGVYYVVLFLLIKILSTKH
ncbi:MAG: ComE-like protein competence protein [Candidatus Amesbacteria bacterium GW2011_GWA1_47_20]|uniref:ComE-like protein competence protein n=1 Tax=Candidatus Amesbacteria bacterium GW2011_GWA1_47_20 TaxID=1618354 RepID=A0A0G1SEW7_9BACT|nr:MAG: ComEC/Rec2-related protein, competence protein ComEC [Microgenomates group bacterium GW2011_GWC1_46_20]KKU67961.1 MAG: ComE-like protein competence protein [Candidatus Amesbacteria bacterium GW2011_GWA1_47_20]